MNVNNGILKQLRSDAGKTMEEIALALGYKSANAYWKIESGMQKLTAEQAKKLADLFGVRMEYFFTQ